jgi:tetratricopeptide (TPR) repeat protein
MPEVALTTVETALQLDANFVPALVQKGNLLSSVERLDEALLCLEHILELDPSNEFC